MSTSLVHSPALPLSDANVDGPPILQSVDPAKASKEFLELVPRDFAREHLLLSQGTCADGEQLAAPTDTSPFAVFNVGVRLGRSVIPIIASSESIAAAIDRAYESITQSISKEPPAAGGSMNVDDIDRLLDEADRNLLSTQGKGPVIKLVDALLFEALQRRASDVHVQPLDDRTLIRYRLDGVLHTTHELSSSMTAALVSRIKVMGRMDIAERRIPQDGRCAVTIGQRPIDLRISSLPTSYGERIVIRLLDTSEHLCDFDQLGMPSELSTPFLERATRSNGIILVTGPTGSGKTTTLYSTLRRTGSAEVNIMTIEDPIEYELSTMGLAISQAQVNTKKGVTFASGLRHILRQDPDVVMIGEIRDLETARIAMQASLTGHLVLSTLHTTDAPSAITRLIDLGVEPYLVSASLSTVLAQRLVRTTHQACNGQGCAVCLESGFRGRIGLYELLVIDEELRELIAHHATLAVLREQAIRNGMQTLRQAGERLVAAGKTTETELCRVAPPQLIAESSSNQAVPVISEHIS